VDQAGQIRSEPLANRLGLLLACGSILVALAVLASGGVFRPAVDARAEEADPASGGAAAGASATIVPDRFPVYEPVSFDVHIRPGRRLAAGSTIECQLPNSFTMDKISPSKVKAWQTNDPAAPHFIRVRAAPGAAEFKTAVRSREFVGGYACPTRHGKCLKAEIVSGEVPAGGEIVVEYRNTTSPWLANQQPGATAHEGQVYVAVDGRPIERFPQFRVLPGPAAYRRVIVPSSVKPGAPLRVLLVSLDKYNNLSSSSFKDVDVRLGDAVLAKGISYTGRGEATVSLPEEGIFRLQAGGVESNPVRVACEPDGPYWGDIHFHDFPSVDAAGNIPYEYARNVSGLDFAATAEHGAGGLPEHWAQTLKGCREWNEPGRFVTILGFEMNLGWHHNVYFEDEQVPMIPSQEKGGSNVSVAQLLEYLKDKKAVTQIHHSGWGFDMRLRYPDTTRLIEIYSMHGESELYDPENPLSFENQRHRPNSKVGPYYARDAWALGQRLVTIGSSDNHFGQPGVRYNSIVGVRAPELTRKAILDGLRKGACYATTGERILLDFRAAGQPMGSEFAAPKGTRLEFRVEVHGTGDLAAVEVFRCPFIEGDRSVPVGQLRFSKNDPAVEKARQSWQTAFVKKDVGGPDFSQAWTAEFDGRPTVYYVRVRQREPIVLPSPLEGHETVQRRPVCAWSSPIWVLPEG
jgi:hypothetical protein